MEVDGDSERLRLSPRSISDVAALVREPIVEDTAGIERSSGTLEESRWPPEQRRRFEHAWLRLQVLPDLDDRERAAEYAVVLFLLLPLVLLIASPWIAPRLAPGVTAWQLSAFALFAFVVAFAMLRQPFTARVADAVVLCAVAFSLCTVWLWRPRAGGKRAGDCIQGCGCRTCACDDDERGSLGAVRSDPQQPDPTLDDEPDRRRVVRRAP